MSEAMQEPKPFSAEFDRLYAGYLAAGAPGSWERWLLGEAGQAVRCVACAEPATCSEFGHCPWVE